MNHRATEASYVSDSRKIRVAFVIDRLYLPSGGTERQLIHLFEGLNRERFAPTVICLHPTEWLTKNVDPSEALVANVEVRKSPSTFIGIRRLAASLRSRGVEIVQTQFRDANLVGVLAASMAGVPTIISTRRGVAYATTPLERLGLRFLNRKVTYFLANSAATARLLVEREGVTPERVTVIHNGIDQSRLSSISSDAALRLRRDLEIPDDVHVVGMVANLRAVKGIEVFLHAAEAVLKQEPRCRFLIVGEGEDGEDFRRMSTKLGLDEQVRFLGARSDVPALLQVFDIGVLASHFESFSNSILEYLAAGLPVVATDVGGAAEVVEDGKNGFLVAAGAPGEMARRIVELLRHPGGPRRWRNSARIPEQFTLESMVAAHEAYYERVRKTPR